MCYIEIIEKENDTMNDFDRANLRRLLAAIEQLAQTQPLQGRDERLVQELKEKLANRISMLKACDTSHP